MKKVLGLFTALLVCFGLAACGSKLPAAEPSAGSAGVQFGVDKHINEETLDKYLGRKDTVYRDMRMLEDPALYESIGGDRFLSGFVKGFEVVPYPYLGTMQQLPVSGAYSGKTLYTVMWDEKGNVVVASANYEESLDILKALFPQDKNVFLMCGGGGYAGMAKKLLVHLGWDAKKVYNVGGYWNYQGKNKVENPKNNGVYDFSRVAYHGIDFDALTAK